MGFEIELKTGEAGNVILRGCGDGTVEMCRWQDTKDPKTKQPVTILVPFKYYASIEQAFERVAKMRIGSSTASDIKELIHAIRGIRSDIKKEMGVM